MAANDVVEGASDGIGLLGRDFRVYLPHVLRSLAGEVPDEDAAAAAARCSSRGSAANA